MITRGLCLLAVATAATDDGAATEATTIDDAVTAQAVIRDFTLTDVDSKDALDAAGCLTSAALASPQLNFQFRDGDSHDIKLEPSPSIFAAGVIEALGASAPVAFSATSGDIQAALTFNCHDAGTSGSIKGLVTKDDDVLELSTSRDEPSIQQHINDNGAIKSDGVHTAAVFSMRVSSSRTQSP